MSQNTLQHRVFLFDPYAIPDDFVVNTSSTMLQNERTTILDRLLRRGGSEEVMMQSFQEDALKQIRDLMKALEWLMKEGIQENLSDVKLFYMDDYVGGFGWTMEGTVGVHTAHSRDFNIDFIDDWYDEIYISVGREMIKSIEVGDA